MVAIARLEVLRSLMAKLCTRQIKKALQVTWRFLSTMQWIIFCQNRKYHFLAKVDFAMLTAQEIQSANLVRKLRFRLGLTQEQFVAELGVTSASINRWENRKVQPSPMALKLLRQRLEQMGDSECTAHRVVRKYL
jgi:putative transcriptional regulator